MPKQLAFLGPAGTFSEEAALLYDDKAQLVPFPSISAVALAVDTGMVEEGIVPIENSLEGSVPETLDLLIHQSKVHIRKEMVLPITHHLLVKPGTQANEIRVIFSHPQALAQCRYFVERCFPKAQMVAALSTATAVEEMMKDAAPSAAIGTKRAAELFGADILAQSIQDYTPNLTRFVILALSDHPPTGQDKTSLCFSFAEDRPGLLYAVLGEFAKRNINLAKIESRPIKETLGRYYFLVDCEGHREDPIVAEALEEVRSKTILFKIFGSYPRFQR
jgi:prephenate dehydratase